MGNEASIQAARSDEVALVQAALQGDLEAIQSLMKQNPQLVYSHSKAGENIWHFAAQGGHAEVLKAVAAAVEAARANEKKQDKLKAQVNHGFNQINQIASKVISSAVPLPDAIAAPMNADIGINAQMRDGTTPLMAAVKAGKPEAVTQLLAAGAKPRKGDNAGATALHHAAWQGQLGCLTALVQHAEQQEATAPGSVQRLLDATTNTGLTPLHYAAWKGRADVLKQLVNAGASLAASSSHDTMGAVAANAGSTPLHLAAMKGEMGIVRLLLRANAKLMAVAAETGQQSMVTPSSGARSDLRKAADKYGKTPATLAWDMQRSDLALILDPSTPLDQAIDLAGQAVKAGGKLPSSAMPAQLPPPPNQQRQQQQRQLAGGSAKWLKARKAGDASVESGPATPVAGSDATVGTAAAGLQRLGVGRSSSKQEASSTSGSGNSTPAASSGSGSGSGDIFLPPPKAWKSRIQQGAAAPVESVGADCRTPTAAVVNVAEQQQQQQKEQAHSCTEGAAAAAAGAGSSVEFGGVSDVQQQQQHVSTDSSSGSSAAVPTGGSLSDPPAEFICPITNELLKDPVRACDGLAYEREAIEVWFQLGNTMMPGGSSRISNERLTPDPALKAAITAWKETVTAAGK